MMFFKTYSLMINLVLINLIVIFSSTSVSNAFNITATLDRYPDFSSFNDLLTQTKLVSSINKRSSITVLALDNAATGGIQGRDIEEVKKIMQNHVVLDYYDKKKLRLLKKKTTVTTMYQSTGLAQGQEGFLKVAVVASGDIVVGSAVADAPLVAKVMRAVVARPFNLSVLQVSTPIIVPGLGEGKVIQPAPPPPYTAPPPSTKKKGGASSSEDGEDDEAPDDDEAAPSEEEESSPPKASKANKETAAGETPAPEPAGSGAGVSHMFMGSGWGVGVAVLMALLVNFVGF